MKLDVKTKSASGVVSAPKHELISCKFNGQSCMFVVGVGTSTFPRLSTGSWHAVTSKEAAGNMRSVDGISSCVRTHIYVSALLTSQPSSSLVRDRHVKSQST